MHVLGRWLQGLPEPRRPFAGITPQAALRRLRERLGKLGAVDARAYRLHDFRRGHAQDLASSGATLAEILKAGEWRSAAFLGYLDTEDLEQSAVLEAHMNMSSEDEEVSGEPILLD